MTLSLSRTTGARATEPSTVARSAVAPPAVATEAVAPEAVARVASLKRQGSRFTIVGSAGTGLQLGLYAVLVTVIGAQIASALSWLASTVVTNRVHRALTFEVHEHEHNGSDQTVAFVTSLAGLGITSIVLAQLADADGLAGVLAILAVNSAVGAGRFFGLRWWLGGAGRHLAAAVSTSMLTARDNISARRMSLHH